MINKPINLKNKLTLFQEHWSPKVVAEMNDYQFKLVKIEGEFVWHNHPETDETFIVVEGSMVIEMRNGNISLNKGDMYVVPKGIDHKPVAKKECHILIIEPKGVVNTGEVDNELTADNDVWI